jgi:hypothetical protein
MLSWRVEVNGGVSRTSGGLSGLAAVVTPQITTHHT